MKNLSESLFNQEITSNDTKILEVIDWFEEYTTADRDEIEISGNTVNYNGDNYLTIHLDGRNKIPHGFRLGSVYSCELIAEGCDVQTLTDMIPLSVSSLHVVIDKPVTVDLRNLDRAYDVSIENNSKYLIDIIFNKTSDITDLSISGKIKSIKNLPEIIYFKLSKDFVMSVLNRQLSAKVPEEFSLI